MSEESEGKQAPSRFFWMVVGGIVVFLATNLFADPIKRIGNDLYSGYIESRDAPEAFLCAPLQEAHFIARQNDEILADGPMGHPNPTSVFFSSNNTELTDLQLLVYAVGHHENDPLIYRAKVSSSDLISGPDVEVTIDGGVLRASVPRMAADEFFHIEAVYGQPVSLILEARSLGYSSEFYGIAGCLNGPDTFRGPYAETVHQFELSTCGEKGDEMCGISGPEFSFEVTEERVMPTLEQWIVLNGEKLYFGPPGKER